jgi:hypothetical protein
LFRSTEALARSVVPVGTAGRAFFVEALEEALVDASRKPPEAFRMAETVSPVGPGHIGLGDPTPVRGPAEVRRRTPPPAASVAEMDALERAVVPAPVGTRRARRGPYSRRFVGSNQPPS